MNRFRTILRVSAWQLENLLSTAIQINEILFNEKKISLSFLEKSSNNAWKKQRKKNQINRCEVSDELDVAIHVGLR